MLVHRHLKTGMSQVEIMMALEEKFDIQLDEEGEFSRLFCTPQRGGARELHHLHLLSAMPLTPAAGHK